MTEPNDKAFARKGQTAALVIAGGGLLAIFAPAIRSALGLSMRYEMLLYLISLAAFIWALVVGYQMWQARAAEKDKDTRP